MNLTSRSRWWRPIAGLIIFMGTALLALFWTFDHFFSGKPSASEAAWTRRHDRGSGQTPGRFWKVPEFHGLTQEGLPIDANALAGNVWVADFIYTRCTSACPTLTARMMLLARKLNTGVRLLSFSVDPGFDRPEVLAGYARRWPHPALSWTLVSTDAGTLEGLAREMRIMVDRNPDDATDITHSSKLFLIDREAWVRGIYDSQDDADLAALTADATVIAGVGAPAGPHPPTADGDPKEVGRQLFQDFGCNGCHADARTAPRLGGFGARRVMLEGASSAVTDVDYLRTSIVQPLAQVVLGYAPSMPSYDGVLNEAQLAVLITYLQSMPAPRGAAAIGSAVDPVCDMKIAVVEATPRVQLRGKTYYFCSDTCRTRFADDPDRYRTAAHLADSRHSR